MTSHAVKAVTIITESALESKLVEEIQELGATGYTITNARGKGSRGTRSGAWDASANIRIEIICSQVVANAIAKHVQATYYKHYAMVLFTSDIEVLRPDKFCGDGLDDNS